ncbi:conserved protein of unknown function [Candidatus Bipolaricaulis anaerobius]|jgi:hypothetical protein|uniref:Uncharacterized protein n=1 Tax=Candidatus Bipolaricaulis anaerobius TaxID=2026885 RepID=A0A2X3MJ33_9BACT|nr:conserved protein of unknown function [Candidatus Bipolaricaulis anaerobius]
MKAEGNRSAKHSSKNRRAIRGVNGTPSRAESKARVGDSVPAVGPEVKALRPRSPSGDFSSHELVTLAVYLLGGGSHAVDTEDVAVKVNELAPGKFVWKRYPAQINLEIVRVYLSDAKKQSKGAYLTGSGTNGWRITRRGLEFARRRIGELQGEGAPQSVARQRDGRWRSRERKRLLASDAYARFRTGGASAVSRQDAERFFRVDEYVTGPARETKVARILEAFGDDPRLGKVVRAVAILLEGAMSDG